MIYNQPKMKDSLWELIIDILTDKVIISKRGDDLTKRKRVG